MPKGAVRWFDVKKGFGFVSREGGSDVFVSASSLPAGVTTLEPGQRVEFGVASSQRGDRALALTLLEAPPDLQARTRKPPEYLAVMVQDLITVLDGILPSLVQGSHLSKPVADRVATLLVAAGKQLADPSSGSIGRDSA